MMTGAYLKVPAKSSSLTNSTHTEKDTLINSFKPDSTLSIHSDPAMSISPDPFTSLDPQSLYNSYYHIGSLLSNGCRCSAIISELDKDSQTLVAYIGRQLSIALKVIIFIYCISYIIIAIQWNLWMYNYIGHIEI